MSPPASPPAGPTSLERALRWLAWCALVLAMLAAGTYLAIRHYVWPNLDRWRPEIARRLGEAAGRPVSLGALSSGFDGLRPWVVVRELDVDDADGRRAFSAQRVRAVLSLRAALRGKLRLALLEVDSPLLRVERIDRNRLRIGGFDLDLDHPGRGDTLARLFAQRRIILQRASVDWIDRVTGEALRLDDVDLALDSIGRRHRAWLRVPSLLDVGTQISAAVEFRRAPFVDVGDWRQWHGEAYFGARSIDLAALSRRWNTWREGGLIASPVLDGLDVLSGRAQLRAWSSFEPGAPAQQSQARIKLDVQGLSARLDGSPLPVSALQADASVSRDDADTTVVFPTLVLDDGEGTALTAIGGEPMLRLGPNMAPDAARFALGRFDAARLMGWLLRLPLPAELRTRLAPLAVDGVFDRFVLDWSSRQPDPRLDVDVAFERLSFARHEPSAPKAGQLQLPGFANVSGNARLTRAGGTATLHGEGAVLRFPGLFAEPAVPLERFDAQLAWTLGAPPQPDAPRSVDLRIESFRFANADAEGEVAGSYRSGGKGIGIADLAGRLTRADATRTARYLPLVIPADVRDWVRSAVRAGHSDDVRFVLRGDLEDFPFRDPATGEFLVQATLRDGRLQYAPGWPAIDRIRGALRFERAGMDIEARSGSVWNVALSNTHARIADFNEPLLRVEGAGSGPAQDMIRFVNESALRTRIDDFTRDTSMGGQAALQLALELPLDDLDAAKVRGSVRFDGNDLVLDRTLPPFDAVRGRLEFTEARLALRGFRGGFLGGEVRVEGDTPEPGHMRLTAQGNVRAEALARLYDDALVRSLSGGTSYRAQVDVRNRASTLVVESDLVGLSSALPAPFAKRADEPWPLRIESVPRAPAAADERPPGDLLRVRLRDDVRLLLERERARDSDRLLVRRGAFALGFEPALPDAGFAVLLNTPSVDLDAWRGLLGGDLATQASGTPREGSARGLSLLPDSISLVAAEVHLAGKTVHDVVLGATRQDASWSATVHARGIDGFFRWHPPGGQDRQGTLLARFSRLSIPEDRIDDVETLFDSTPGRLPALDIAADELVLDERSLGRLELRATNTGGDAAPIWQLQRLHIANDAATLDATGTWQTRPGVAQPASTMDFRLAIADAGRLLTRLGYRDVLRGGAGKLGGKLQWAGSPMRLDTPSLAGELELSLGKGQFLKSEPGIAKLIGVLSLQSLRRRLVFDFRDVFAEGFAFDELGGEVRVQNGIARTDDFHMRGVAAQVRIRGEADIAAEAQSLVVQVRPDLNAGLASLAYAAIANPALGLGSFVAQMMLREPLQQIFAYEYDVTGPWDDPQVKRRARSPDFIPSPDVPSADLPPQPQPQEQR